MKIAWQSHGSGAPVLLIQGLGYGGWGWEPVVPGLAERFRVLTFDNRGIGGSDKPAGPYTTAELAGDALQVLDEAGADRAHVVGASLGGMIAQEIATLTPERVEKLVLCCTTPGGADGVPMPEVTVQLFQEAATLAPDLAIRRFIENALGAGGSMSSSTTSMRAASRTRPTPPGGMHKSQRRSALQVPGRSRRRRSSCTEQRTTSSTTATPTCSPPAFPALAWSSSRARGIFSSGSSPMRSSGSSRSS